MTGDPSLTALRQVRNSEEITDALRGVSFPISKHALMQRLASTSLRYDDSTATPISEIVRGITIHQFSDVRQAQQALDARWARIAKALAAVDERERRGKGTMEEK